MSHAPQWHARPFLSALRNRSGLAVAVTLAATSALVLAGCGSDGGGGSQELATGEGIRLLTGFGCASSPGVLSVAALDRSAASSVAPLPPAAVFTIGAAVAPVGLSFGCATRLEFRLPRPMQPNSSLHGYALTGEAWQQTGTEARVALDGATATASLPRSGRYAFFLDTSWQTASYGGTTFVTRTRGIPTSYLRGHRLVAQSSSGDPSFMTKLCEVTHKDSAGAQYMLRSFQSTGSEEVSILQLATDVYVTRYWGPSDKIGRWYVAIASDRLMSPDEARREYALPDSNNARNVTLYRLRRGTMVVYGGCADMTWNSPVFGPYATGGAEQFFVPDATVWPSGALNPETTALVEESRYPQG